MNAIQQNDMFKAMAQNPYRVTVELVYDYVPEDPKPRSWMDRKVVKAMNSASPWVGIRGINGSVYNPPFLVGYWF
jgi:hypothetical protein